jgi:hypothetical protein
LIQPLNQPFFQSPGKAKCRTINRFFDIFYCLIQIVKMKKLYPFLCLFFACQSALLAQSPGGVSTNLSLWLRADAASTLSPSSGSLNSWSYFNNANAFTATVGSQPTVAPSTFNFLPSIAFNGSQFMTGPSGASAPIPAGALAYSVFAVWSSTTPTGGVNQRVWNQRPASSGLDNSFDGAALWVFASGSQYGDQPEVSPFTTGLGLTYAPNVQNISQLNLLAQNTNDLELVDQTNIATGPVVVSTDPGNNATVDRVLSNAANLLGARSSIIDEPFIGNLAELIVYSGPVSGVSRSVIFSYLSMKYGIPTNTSLLSSNGTTVWDAVANSAYNNFVFGIGMDNASGLAVTQSNSQATGSGNGAGISGKGNIILSNPVALGDQQFVMVGSNNAGLTETTTNLPPLAGPGSQRLATQWLVQNSGGGVGSVNLSFDFTGLTVTGAVGTPADFRLIVDQDGDGNFTTGTQSYYQPSTFTGNVANFTGIALNQSAQTVIAIMSNAGAGTPLPVTWSAFTATPAGNNVDLNWTVGANAQGKVYEVDHSADGVNFTQIGEVANDPAVQTYSFVHVNAGPGTHYYRIQEIDLDGKSIYSQIVSATINQGDFAVQVLNNPVVGNVQAEVLINAVKAGNASIEIWTLGGNKVASQELTINTGSNRVSLPLSGLAASTYAVKIRVSDVTHVVQIVKL